MLAAWMSPTTRKAARGDLRLVSHTSLLETPVKEAAHENQYAGHPC